MTLENENANAEGTPEGEGSGNAQPEKSGEETFTQADVNRFNAGEKRKRQAAERALEAANKRIADFEESQQSDTEKAISDAVKNANKEWETRFARVELERSVERALVGKGLHPELADLVLKRVETAEDVDGVVSELMESHDLFKVKAGNSTPAPVGSAPTPPGEGYQPGRTWTHSEIRQLYIDHNGDPPEDLRKDIQLARKQKRVIADIPLARGAQTLHQQRRGTQ